jgi:ribonucleotide monophosphatase NagD (HAD superfamily)
MKTCVHCGAQSYRVESQYCLKCGAKLPESEDAPAQNICTNPDCDWHKTKFIYPDDARFCDVCGSKTVYNR